MKNKTKPMTVYCGVSKKGGLLLDTLAKTKTNCKREVNRLYSTFVGHVQVKPSSSAINIKKLKVQVRA